MEVVPPQYVVKPRFAYTVIAFRHLFINVRLTPGLTFSPQAGQAQLPLLELDVFYCTCQRVYQGNGRAPIHFQRICLALFSPFFTHPVLSVC